MLSCSISLNLLLQTADEKMLEFKSQLSGLQTAGLASQWIFLFPREFAHYRVSCWLWWQFLRCHSLQENPKGRGTLHLSLQRPRCGIRRTSTRTWTSLVSCHHCTAWAVSQSTFCLVWAQYRVQSIFTALRSWNTWPCLRLFLPSFTEFLGKWLIQDDNERNWIFHLLAVWP